MQAPTHEVDSVSKTLVELSEVPRVTLCKRRSVPKRGLTLWSKSNAWGKNAH
jgi:hypothetical protein